MSSLDVSAGKELVKSWAAIPADIQISVSFRLNGIAGATFAGRIEGLVDEKLSVVGDRGSAFVDLSYVEDARDLVTEAGLRAHGISLESGGECVTFTLLGVDVTLITLPRSRLLREDN
jgi:hypothetical protein